MKKFSGGMKRRLEIARGLLHTPKILFLDEPTLGLDPQSRNQLWTHVKQLNETEKATVFLTTHYMDEADRVAHGSAIIDHGKIVAQGRSAELKAADADTRIAGGRRFLALTGTRSATRQRGLEGRDAACRADVARINVEEIGDESDLHSWLRELKRYVRSRAQIVASLGQPMLYLLALGFGLGPVFQEGRAGQLSAVLAPGVIGMTVLFTSMFSGIGLLWDRQFGFLKETLVAPVPRLQIMVGRTLGGATVAVIQGAADPGGLPDRRLPAAHLAGDADGLSVHGADRGRFRRAGDRDRLGAQGHAGLSADHELPGDADLLSFGRAVSADEPGRGAECDHAAGSAVLRRGRAARRADQQLVLRPGVRYRGARRRSLRCF